MWKSSQHLFEVLHSKCLLSTKFACVKDCLGVRDVILHDIEAVLGWNYSKKTKLNTTHPPLKRVIKLKPFLPIKWLADYFVHLFFFLRIFMVLTLLLSIISENINACHSMCGGFLFVFIPSTWSAFLVFFFFFYLPCGQVGLYLTSAPN